MAGGTELKKLIAILLAFTMAGCGGGDPEDDRVYLDPPKCKEDPRLCA